MKTSALSIPFGGIVARFLVVAALSVQFAWAQDATKNAILQNKADQQDVRQHTGVLADQIQSLIDELTDNGISGNDIKVLQATKGVLSNLSLQEMTRVIASLQKATEAAGTKAGKQSIVDAYADQKGIILEFRQILKEYEQRQAANVLPAKFKELADRQTQVMWTTAQVATDTAGKSPDELNTMQQTTSQIVLSDQNALANNVALAKQMLEKAAQDSTGDQGRAMQQAQQDLKDGKLQDALDQAAADLNAGHLLQATTEQKIARDQLRQLAKDLNPPTTTADALADSAAALNKLIEQQKDLLIQTYAAEGAKPRVTGLNTKEGALVDQADSLQSDMQTLSPGPAGLVKDAINPMQAARAKLSGTAFTDAASDEKTAIAKLEEAAKQLAQQVADAQKAAEDASKDATAKLEDLQKQIQQAMQQQQQTAQQTANASAATPPDTNQLAQDQQAQSALQQQVNAMQQAASPLSLPAAQALANAANAMSQAQQAMSNPADAQAAQTAQQAAQQALQQANQDVGQQIAQAQQQSADPSQLANAANDLQQAQTDVSNALADTNIQQSGSPPSDSQQASAPQPGGQPPGSQQASTPQPGGQPPGFQQASAPQPGGQPPGSQQASTPQSGGQPPGSQQASTPQPGGQPPGSQQASAPQPGGQPPGSQQADAPQPGGQQSGNAPPSNSPTLTQAQADLAQAALATQAAAAVPGLPAAAASAVQDAEKIDRAGRTGRRSGQCALDRR